MKTKIDITKYVHVDEIYNYLLGELYPLPSCNTCQYSDIRATRVPCNKCDEACSQYKLHRGHQADLKNLTKGIVKIIKTYGTISNKRTRR